MGLIMGEKSKKVEKHCVSKEISGRKQHIDKDGGGSCWREMDLKCILNYKQDLAYDRI